MPERGRGILVDTLQVTGLWAVAVAQPLYDVVSRSPEFFVAHDARPVDLVALIVALGLIGPAACVLPIAAAHRLGPRWRALTVGVVVGALCGTIALAAIRAWGDWSGAPTLAAATAVAVAVGYAYVRAAPVRLFATFLSPAALVVPAVFLLNPAIASLVDPPETDRGAIDGVTFETTPPVVVVVFDQLPLASLLDRDGAIDEARYPHFAALADEATWFRNASAVSPTTSFALPAILTGRYPERGRLPTVDDHPDNLFTLFGSRYRLDVIEPLTSLCPASLCPVEPPGILAWLGAVLRDLRIVWLQTVLPDDLTRSLPPVTQTWADFVVAEPPAFQDNWRERRRDDRRRSVERFVAQLGASGGGSRPALHFLHVLLPHEPWLYLPTGQVFSVRPQIPGLVRDSRWLDAARPIALNYQRHLLQVGYVDTILGDIVARLRQTGIWDDALVVVTADHGASFRPGYPFRRPRDDSFADIASVPLLIKRPGQQAGSVSRENVETIDILPTIAAVVGAALPWEANGANALGAPPARPAKTMFLFDGTRRMEGPADLTDLLAETVARKFAIFESGSPFDQPRSGSAYNELVGEPAAAYATDRRAPFDATLDAAGLLSDVRLDSDFVPAQLTGAVVPRETAGRDEPPPIAVAVNGVVAAVTQPYAFSVSGRTGMWEAIVDPRWFTPGANAVGLFTIREDDGGAMVLDEAYRFDATVTPPPTNLILQAVAESFGVTTSGFHRQEWRGVRPVRWTDGHGRLAVPIDAQSPPAALHVDVNMTGGQTPKVLRIDVNGCTLHRGIVTPGWSATFRFDRCPVGGETVEIELISGAHVPVMGDTRTLGLAFAAVELLEPESPRMSR